MVRQARAGEEAESGPGKGGAETMNMAVFWTVIIVICALLYILGFLRGRDAGYEKGREKGYEEGLKDGIDSSVTKRSTKIHR